MDSAIVPMVLGVFISVLGVLNMRGNLASIHWYHRHRVTDADKVLFGKKVGLGTVIVGVSIALFGVFSLLVRPLQADVLTAVGAVIAVAGSAAGIVLSLYAIIKYNKGLF